jgi:hypothetical protein
MGCFLVVLVLIVMVVGTLRYLIHGPAARMETHIFDGDQVDYVITYGGNYINGVDLEDIDNLDDIELIDSRRFGLMYADEYPPYNALRAEREQQRFGFDPFEAVIPRDTHDDGWDEDNEWDREDELEW